jgi:restriction system protein
LFTHHPHRVEPVTPIRDFDLACYSFVEAVDVVASLDSRTDLTKISPTEFEHFVRQLFEASGLEGWTTERSGDDGVDAVVINRDPMVGGLTIVQANRYTNVIGVSHIREFWLAQWTRSARWTRDPRHNVLVRKRMQNQG